MEYNREKISIHAARVGCDRKHGGYLTNEKIISIHAARVGCDNQLRRNTAYQYDFNPRSPSGLRQRLRWRLFLTNNISIHAARVGCDGT